MGGAAHQNGSLPKSMKTPVSDRLRRIEGRHNAWLKELRRAFSQAELTESGACAIEGVRVIEEAIRSGLRFDAVFFSQSAENRAERLLPQIGAKVETLVVPDALFGSAVASESPQGVAALVRLKRFSLEDVLKNSGRGILLAVAGIQDPGNLGTIIRSAEAFGAAGVLVAENTVSPFNSKVVRASAGSLFRLPVVQVKLTDAIRESRESEVRWMATSSHKGISIDQADLTGPTAVLIGSEGAGISRDMMAQMDEVIAIPHQPQVESLNAGVAASIVLYEAARQRIQLTTETRRQAEHDS
jgi:RNA methyltransferase, TrmH family